MKQILMAIGCLLYVGSAAAASEGEYMAKVSDCVACHTAEGGQPMAGGKKFPTPVGDIYATNITPDKTSGIGNYSYDDFEKAVRQGIAKDGHALYPAMPYPSYAKMTDKDIHALYDYFMHEVPASAAKNKESDIPWLLSARWPLHVWNWLFVDEVQAAKPVTHVDKNDALLARGAYLVEGPGHCGACHTPRGVTMQEKAYDASSDIYLSGATIDGWYAPSLRNISMSQDELKDLLRMGRSQHNAISGPMSEVITQSTQYLTDNDMDAISFYLLSFNHKVAAAAAATPVAADGSLTYKPTDGKTLYSMYCSTCHGDDGKGKDFTVPTLVNNALVTAKDPSSLISVISQGAETPQTHGNISFKMPAYKNVMSKEEMNNVVNYVRGSWGNNAENNTGK
ncbi:putative diheme cytochrome c553 [Buttiauxella brennerae ATCC 51605]|uniref:Putative diheme cytochrome c553 n=1 Tax=Buttiauxella brennerae ATCC 51605 TaxID=1354251 RepID=A0A1B7IQC4_9ENTR|nr:cytochrome c [Buttiauxella brennerae]OAT31942.1 putative diheme cytochrome c553 [Buttiauxella brennerae ATCC 51605]